MVDNYAFGKDMGAKDNRGRSRGLQQYSDNIARFFKVMNGRCFGEHFDMNAPIDEDGVQRDMVEGLLKVPLRSQPTPPEEGKWTKLGHCIDFFVLNDTIGCMQPLADEAYRGMKFLDFAADIGEVAAGNTGQTSDSSWHKLAVGWTDKRGLRQWSSGTCIIKRFVLRSTCWIEPRRNPSRGTRLRGRVSLAENPWLEPPDCHLAQAGSRYRRTMHTINDGVSKFARLVFAIVAEPLRYLTFVFLRTGHMNPNCGKFPPAMSLCSKASSVVHWVLQYYSMLLDGRGSRLTLLWTRSDCNFASLEEWMLSRPREVDVFRRSILVATAHVNRHHAGLFFRSWPYRLLSMADPRNDDAMRTQPCIRGDLTSSGRTGKEYQRLRFSNNSPRKTRR